MSQPAPSASARAQRRMPGVLCVVVEVDRAVIDGVAHALDDAFAVVRRHDGPVTVHGVAVSVDRMTASEAARFLERSLGRCGPGSDSRTPCPPAEP